MRILCILLLSMCFVFTASATHEMAGEITFKPMNASPGCLDYQITVTTYTDDTHSTVDRCSLMVKFGDGTEAPADRSSLPGESICTNGYSCTGSQGCGWPLNGGFSYYKRNTYRITHTYAKSGLYLISINDYNYVTNVCNVPNSVNTAFYMVAMLLIDPNVVNSGIPGFNDLSLDSACTGFPFYHQILLSDPDGDSLSYSVGPILDSTNHPISSMPPVSPGGSFSIDSTGRVAWLNPPQICWYTFGVQIKKWRRFASGPVLMAAVQRSFMILSSAGCHSEIGGIQENEPAIEGVKTYPNPSGAALTISWEKAVPYNGMNQVSFHVYDLSGRVLKTVVGTDEGSLLLPSGSFSPGMYIFDLQLSGHKPGQGKFVITE